MTWWNWLVAYSNNYPAWVVVGGSLFISCVIGGFLHDRFRNPFQTPMFEFTISDYGIFCTVLWPLFMPMIVGSRLSNWLR